MKKFAVILGFCGFLLLIGAAGGADRSPLMPTMLCMLGGFGLLWLSERVYLGKIRLFAPQKRRPAVRKALRSTVHSTVRSTVRSTAPQSVARRKQSPAPQALNPGRLCAGLAESKPT